MIYTKNLFQRIYKIKIDLPHYVHLVIALLIGINFYAFSTDYKIESADGVPLPDATLSIVSANDSIVIESSASDSQGLATISAKTNPNDHIYVYLYGHKPYCNTVSNAGSTIVMEPDATTLGEVVVSASADHVKVEAGKLTFTPGDLKSQVINMNQLLKFVPMLTVDENSIHMLNMATKIYINGKELKIPAEHTLAYINSINPKSITNIELMPNGNSSVNSAILNINMPDPTKGVRGNLTANGSYRSSRFNTNDQLSLSYAKGKFMTDFIVQYRLQNTFQHINSFYDYPEIEKTVNEESSSKSLSHSLNGQLKLAYRHSDRSDLNFWMSVTTAKLYNNQSTSSSILENVAEIKSTFKSSYDIPWTKPTIKAVAAWTYKTDYKGSMLDITADYMDLKNQYDTDYIYDDYSYIRTFLNIKRGVRAAASYTQVLTSDQILTAMYDFSDSYMHKESHAPNYDSDFKYNDIIHFISLYWKANWNRYFNTGLFLRYDHTDLTVKYPNHNENNYNKKYNYFKPILVLSSYIPKADQSIDVRLSLTQYRPYFSMLDPQKIETSSTTYYIGNPNLEPSKVWSLSVDYSLLGCFFASFRFDKTNDEIIDYTYMKDGFSVTSYANMGNKTNVELRLQYINTFWNFWRLNLTTEGIYAKFRGGLANANLDYTNLQGNLSINNFFTLSRRYNISAELNYQYYSPNKTATSRLPHRHDLSIYLSKSFNNGMSLSMSAFNLLCQRNKATFTSDDYSYNIRNLEFPMSFSLTFIYNFGNQRVNTGRTRNKTNMDNR